MIILIILATLCSHAMGQSNKPTPSVYPTFHNSGPAITTTLPDSDKEATSEQCVFKQLTNLPQKYNTSFEEESEDGWMNKFTPGRYFYNPFLYYSNFYRPFNPYYQRRWRRSLNSNYYNIPFHYQSQGASSFYHQPLFTNNPYSTTGNGWKRNSGGTPTAGTGPSSASDGKFYLYMESDDYRPGDSVTLYTKRELKGCFCMHFSYHLNVNNSGKKASNHTLTVKTQDKVLKTYTTPSDKWELASLHLDTMIPTMIRIIATRGSNNHGDIAIDRIKISPGQCSLYRLGGAALNYGSG